MSIFHMAAVCARSRADNRRFSWMPRAVTIRLAGRHDYLCRLGGGSNTHRAIALAAANCGGRRMAWIPLGARLRHR